MGSLRFPLMGKHLDREKRKGMLVEAALHAFGKKGYHATQVSDIIAQAKVARGTFYLYFEGKREIFAAVLAKIFDEVQTRIQNIPREAFGEIPSQILGNLRRVAQLLLKNERYVKLLFSDAVGLDEEFDAQLREFYDRILDYIHRGLRQGQQMGFIREGDVEVLALCLLGCFKEVFYQYILGAKRPSAKLLEREIYAFVINSLVHPSLREQVGEYLKTVSQDKE
jgi:AcrR family transcriptional regulator